LRDSDKFDAWLHRLTVNACLDAVRRRKRRPIEVELSPMVSPFGGDEAGHIADRDQLERGFRRLGPDLRAVLVLHYYVGLSASAVAETLDIPKGTAQSRLHRALAELRAAIAADERQPVEQRSVIA
jgi:RNA polymerase sigma factor (sigma-70 family)